MDFFVVLGLEDWMLVLNVDFLMMLFGVDVCWFGCMVGYDVKSIFKFIIRTRLVEI